MKNYFLFNLLLLLLLMVVSCINAASNCNIPNNWFGVWYQSKDMDLLNINRTNFINKGFCVENKQDKYLFYDNKEFCYRCIFIMQKHYNVLQYRASYCTDQSDFYANCQNLSPESELVTIYRENSVTERCPLNGIYSLLHPSNSASQGSRIISPEDQDGINNYNGKCSDENRDAIIQECADQTMLKLEFNKCINLQSFIVNCVAHWTEGNTNYLIGRITTSNNQRVGYRCLVYTETSSSGNDLKSINQNGRYKYEGNSYNQEDFVEMGNNLNSNVNNNAQNSNNQQETIQISISQDEFCRNIDNIIDDQYSFTFSKSRFTSNNNLIVNYTRVNSNHKRTRRHNNNNNSRILSINTNRHTISPTTTTQTCKFPRWFNKRWSNLKQTKLFYLDHKLDTLIVNEEKNSIISNKFTCIQTKSKKINHFQAIVRTLSGCSNGYQCITITSRSEFVLEIKFGKLSYSSHLVDCHESIQQEIVYVDSLFGVQCPFKGNIYLRNDQFSKSQQIASSPLVAIGKNDKQPCKYTTQTQILQIGCQNDQRYSLRTKLCYPNQYQPDDLVKTNVLRDSSAASSSSAFTQLESEINLVCLAHWTYNENVIVISRSMSNEILCSVWNWSADGKQLRFYEADQNCNYFNKRHLKMNYEFTRISNCDEQSLPYSSSYSNSYHVHTTHFKLVILLLILNILHRLKDAF